MDFEVNVLMNSCLMQQKEEDHYLALVLVLRKISVCVMKEKEVYFLRIQEEERGNMDVKCFTLMRQILSF